MSRIVRVALTETVNAFQDMPSSVANINVLKGRLEEIRIANVRHHQDLVREAKSQGVQCICFGEAFTAPYFALSENALWHEMAEPIDGPSVQELQTTAAELAMVIVAPIYELDPKTGDRFNTAVVIDNDGSICGFYSKTHIPNGTNEQGTFGEGFYFARSTGRAQPENPRVIGDNPFFPVFATSIGNIGVAICYDRHFEGTVGALAEAGAEIVFSPAVTFGEKSRRMWDLEFAVDAARHRVFIGGSNRKGREAPWNQEYFGASHFVGPDGPCDDVSTHSNLIIADIDLVTLSGKDPSGWNLQRDRRQDIL